MNRKLLMLASLMSLSFVTLIHASANPNTYRGSSNSTPDASRVYADRFIPEILPYQAIAAQGILDTTFGDLSGRLGTGSLDISSICSGAQAFDVQTLSDGTFVVFLSDTTTNSYVAKFTETGILDTSFGTEGVTTLSGLYTSEPSEFFGSMVIDAHDRIVVSGIYKTTGCNRPWIIRLMSDGSIDSNFNWTDNSAWRHDINVRTFQSSGKLIVVGFNGSNAQIARYNQDGSLDECFGVSGYTVLNGSNDINSTPLPLSCHGIYSTVIDADNKIYVTYFTGYNVNIARFAANGSLDTSWGESGVINLSDLNGATDREIFIAMDSNANIIIAARVGGKIKVTALASSDGGDATPSFTNYVTDCGTSYDLRRLITVCDGSIFLVGSDVTTKKMRVTRLTNTGVLDTNWNGSGFNEFSIGTPDTSSQLYGASIAPDGKLYVAGFQVNASTTTPYVSRLNNDLYVSQVAQYPAEVAQGDFDYNFGTNSSETHRGVNYLFNGKYGATLQQQANTVIELASGKLLVGLTGKLNCNNSSNMMLERLNADGTFDTCFGCHGKLNIAQEFANEYLLSIIEDQSGNIIISGYDGIGNSILRKFNSDGSLIWSVSDAAPDQAVNIAIQSSQRIILFKNINNITGGITAINPSTGALDLTFNTTGYTPGKVSINDLGLTNMGQVYGSAIDPQDNILIAYRNTSSGNIDVAYIFENGLSLIPEFGTNGILSDAFSSIDAQNVRLALDDDQRFILAVTHGAYFKLKRFYVENGILDTNFGTDGQLCFSSGGTTAVLNQLTTLNNNKIIVTGAADDTDDSMLIARISCDGQLDAWFNSQGAVPGILPIKVGHIVRNYYERAATGLAVQADSGNMIIVGNEQQTSSESIPMIARIYGQCGTTQMKQSPITGQGAPGTLDTEFGCQHGAEDLTDLISAGALNVVYAYRSTNAANQGKLLLGVNTASNSVEIARVYEYNMTLDTSFGASSGTITFDSLTGLDHISLDKNNNILIAGTSDGKGWAKRLTVNGQFDVAFECLSHLIAINGIYQQESGRYIVAGTDNNGKGVLVAFQDKLTGDHTTLHVDRTFSPLATTSGWYTIGITGLYNLAINSDDTIVVAYADTTVKIAKVTANASGLVQSFGTAGILDTGIIPNSSSAIRIALDGNGKIIVASSVGGTSVAICRYTAAGAVDTSFNTTGVVHTISGLGSSGVKINDLIIDTNNKIIIVGFNAGGGNGNIFVARLDNSGNLDSIFNKVPTSPDVEGILTFSIDGSTNAYSASIYINGMIYIGGLGTTNKPLLMAVYGDDYVGQVEEQPWEVAAGVIDTTLDTLTPGSNILNLQNYLSSTLDLTGFVATALHIYCDGSMLIGLSNYYTYNVSHPAKSIIVKLNAAGAIDTSFNNGSGGTPGYVTITGASWIYQIYVADGTNDDASMYVTGYMSDDTIMTHKFSATGADLGVSVTDADLYGGMSIVKSSNERILVSAWQVDSPYANVIVAYKPDGSGRDLSFGNNGNGEYVIGVDDVYTSFLQIDSYDRLYYAYPYVTGSTITIGIDRLKVDGTAVEDWFNGTVISCTANQLSETWAVAALDENNNRLVVAAQDGDDYSNNIYVRRYNTSTGNDDGSMVTISMSGQAMYVEGIFIDENQYSYVYGYTYEGGMFIARITPSMALDTTGYAVNGGTPGIAYVATYPNLAHVYAAALHPDRRVYVIGYNHAENNGYMARVFGDVYTSEVSDATFEAVPGTADLTVNPNVPSNGIVIPGLAGYTAYSVYDNGDGSSYVAFGNGTNVILGKLNADNVLVTSGFGVGSTGLTAPVAMGTVGNVIFGLNNSIIVVGMTSGGSPTQVIYNFPVDGSAPATFSSTINLSVATQIAQQKSGRYLVTGKYGSLGVVLAYQNTGLAVDTTFGPYGLNGYYSTGSNSPVDDMAIDCNDNIYIVFRNASNHVIVQKINAQGGALALGFTGGDTGMIGTGSAHLALNSDGNILVGATTASGIQTVLYNGSTGNASPSAQTITSANSPILTRMVAIGTQFVSSAYTNAPAMLTILQAGDSSLDTTFNPSGATPGVASSDPLSSTQMNSISVQVDAKFVMVGGNGSNPVLMRVYGHPYASATQDKQFPGIATTGTLDRTLYPSSGALNLANLLTSVVCLYDYTAKFVYTYANNNILLAFDNGSNTILVRAHKDSTVDTGFNGNGYVTVSGAAGITGLAVDSFNNIYITGGNPSWTYAFNDNGTVMTGFTAPTTNLSAGSYAVEVQSLDRIIVAGQDASGGVLYDYTSTTGALDTEFGNGSIGIFATNVASPIADIAIDDLDRIAIVYNDGWDNSVLARVSSDGSAVDALGNPTAIAGVNGNQLKVLNDNAGNLIVAAATVDGFALRRYNTNGVGNPTTEVDITAGSSASSVLGTIYTTSDNKTVLIGYETTCHKIYVVRLTTDFILDTTFNPNGCTPGILETRIDPMAIACCGTIYNDDRILIVGSNECGTHPYMARVFGDDYVTVVSESDTLGLFGAVDTTYATSGANILGGTLGSCIPYTLRTRANGNVYLGVEQQNSSHTTTIVKFNGQGGIISAFGGPTGLALTEGTYDRVRDIKFDHSQTLLATGGPASVGGAIWALRLNSVTGAIINSFAASTLNSSIGILEQTNDRIVVAGSDVSNNGLIVGYLPNGSAIDATFGTVSGTTSTGYFSDTTNVNGPITSFAMDSKDRMLIGYTKSSRAAVARVLANGTAVDANVDNYVGFATTGFIADVFGSTNISGNVYVAVDTNDYVYVAAVNNSGANIVINSYDTTGTLVNSATAITSVSSPVLSGIMVTDTNEIMLFGNYASGIFTLQLQTNLTLDTNFGTAGIATYNVAGISNVKAGSLTVDGTFYLAGDNSSVNPILMRAYADRFIGQVNEQPTIALPGTFDVALNGNGGINLADRSASVSLTGYAGQAIYAYPNGDELLMALDNGTTTKIVRTNADGFLDTAFGTSGFTTANAPTGVQDLTIDDAGNILAVGAIIPRDPASISWINRYNAAGTSVTNFATATSFTHGSKIRQQLSGRYLVSGYDTSVSQGALVAWQSTGAATDKSFGLVSQASPQNDRYVTGVNANVDSFVINNDDTIVIAYRNGNNVTLRKLNADASQLDYSFGSNGTLVAIVGASVFGKVFLIKDENQNLVIAARTDSNEYTVIRYDATGTELQEASMVTSLTSPIITGLQETAAGNILVTGYDGSGNAFASSHLAAGFSLDSSYGTSGLFRNTVAGLTQVNASAIRRDGKAALLGQDASSNPILLSVNGYPYDGVNTTALQFPSIVGAAGTLDTTFDSSGALNLGTALSLNLSSASVQKLYAYDDGRMLIAYNKNSGITNTTTVVRLNKDQSLDQSFGNHGSLAHVYTSGIGYITILGAAVVNDMFVDDAANADGSIYLTGTNSGSPWYTKISSSGAFSGISGSNHFSMTNANRIRISTNGRLLIAGKTASSGIIEATVPFNYVDYSFGNGTAAYQTGVNTPIADMALDQFDRMYIAYSDGNATPTIVIKRILDNGGAVDTTLTVPAITQTNALSTTQILLVLDEANNQMVVAVQDGSTINNIIKVRRFSMIDGSATGSLDSISISGKTLQLSDLFIDVAQNIYVVGYNSTDNNVVVARINSTSSTTIALDNTYATGGIANVTAGGIQQVTAGVIDLDNRVYVAGNGSGNCYLARLFGDVYNLEDTKANPQGLPGALDLTLDAATGGIVMSAGTSFGSALNGYTGRGIFANADGTSYVAFGNGSNVIIGKLDCDQVPVTSGFGTNGLTAAVAMAVVNSLAIDAQGRIIISGTNGGAAVVLRYPTNGAAPQTFASSPLVVANNALEQQSSRILVAGRQTSPIAAGVIYAYENTGLAPDISFGQYNNDGFYVLSVSGTPVNQPIDDFVIDMYDNIYLVYRDTTIKLQKVVANGSNLDPEFNSGITIDTGIAATQQAHIAINSDGNILVAASVSSNIQTALYNGITGAIIGTVQTIASGTPILTKITGNGTEFVASAYQITGGTPQMLTISMTSAGVLDISFADETGIAQTLVQSANQMNWIAVQPDGRLLMIGQQTVSSVNYPVLERVYGYTSYVTGDAQFPGAAVTGTVDVTLYPTTGALDLTLVAPGADLTGFTAKRIYTYADAKIVVAFDNGTDTKIVRVYKDASLDTTFNEVGYMTLTGVAPVTSLYVDQYDNIFVAGSTAGIDSTSWVQAFDDAGSSIGFNAPGINLDHGGYAMELQSFGRTIIAGKNCSSGTLIGYTNTGCTDPEFGCDGLVNLDIAAPIADITIDILDRIVFAAVVDGASVVQRIDPTGTLPDTNFGTPAALTGITGNEIRVMQDNSGNIVIGVATSAGFKLRQYSSVDGSTLATSNNITASGVSQIGNIYATSDGKITLIGYTQSDNIVVARFNSDLTLDATFNPNGSPAGVLLTTIGLMTSAFDGTIYADNHIYVVGGGSNTDPFMARIFGDVYASDLSQSPVYGVPGTLDRTFGPDDNGALELDSLSDEIDNAIPKAISMKKDGSMVVAMQAHAPSSNEAFVVSIKDNLTLNSPGVIDIESGAPGLKSMTLDALHRILVAGNSDSVSWINRYDDCDGSQDGIFPTVSRMTAIVGLLTQSNQRVILGGDQDACRGLLVGLAPSSFVDGNPTTTPVFDATFGCDSRFINSNINSINSFAIDCKDRIVVGFVSGSTVQLARIRPNGSALDITFNADGLVTTDITTASGIKPARVALGHDDTIVVATTTTTGVSVRRYDETGTIENVGFDITNGAMGLTSPVVTQLLTTTTNEMILLGFDSVSNGNMFAMRLTAEGLLDTTFNPEGTVPGILTFVIHDGDNIHVLYAATIASDGRIVAIAYEDDVV